MKKILFILSTVIGLYFPTASLAMDDWVKTGTATEGKHFVAYYKSKPGPVPLNQIHSWVVHITDTRGVSVENAIISISGGMPAHHHGLPTMPVASEISQGDYLIDGLKFSMTGVWEIVLDISAGNIKDKITFSFTL